MKYGHLQHSGQGEQRQPIIKVGSGGVEATEMVNSPRASNALVGTDEEWRAVLLAAQELEEKVVSLSRRLAAVEKRLSSGERQVSARPR